jgi:ring-1,2-phenylacetyl-CoA epoxidase subunit PaaC
VSDALAALLLAMADDELVIGWFDSEWTGVAPMLEEDVAMSSLAQDELGHANALYHLLADLNGGARGFSVNGARGLSVNEAADAIAFDRGPDAFTHAVLLDRRGPGGGSPEALDWAYTIARRWLYDTADAVRLEALAGCPYTPLAELAAKLRREETYHLAHADIWLGRLAAGGPARERLLAAWGLLWPLAGSVLAPLPGDRELLGGAALGDRWLDAVQPRAAELGLPTPADQRGVDHPRSRRPGPDDEGFRWLWGQMTQVRRAEPGAVW